MKILLYCQNIAKFQNRNKPIVMMLIYGLSLLLALTMLILWFRFQDKSAAAAFRNLFFLSLLAYFGSLFTQVAPMSYKLEVLIRDLVFIGVFGTAFSYIARLRAAFWIGLIMTVAGGFYYYKTILRPSFPFQQPAKQITLDAEGELLIEVKQGADLQRLAPLFEQHDLDVTRAFSPQRPEATDLDDFYLIDVPENADLDAIRSALRQKGIIEHVEDNEQIQVSPMRSKRLPPKIEKKYGINDPGLENLWSFEQMKMDELYQLLTNQKPKKEALIAILDTGVDAKHEDLASNYTSLRSKYDDDPRGHGTHCAGIAGAVSNNGIGVASYSRTNDFVEITSIKVLNSYGMGTQKGIINGIIEAADKGADVISLSLGGPSNDRRQRAYSEAVAYAKKAGAIVIAAAGNSSMNAKDYSPANADGIITVSAVDHELQQATFTNTVQDVKMGIAAPGVGIYSTVPNNAYDTYNGTSMATPYVAGLIGLMKSLQPDLTAEEAHRILQKTGTKTSDTRLTGRFIQPAKAVKALR